VAEGVGFELWVRLVLIKKVDKQNQYHSNTSV
jgi:hypothetical protein